MTRPHPQFMKRAIKFSVTIILKSLGGIPACIILSSCSFEDKVTGIPYGSGKVVYERGSASLISNKKNSVMIIPPPSDNYAGIKEIPFFVVVGNKSNKTFDFYPTRIIAKWESKRWTNPPKENVVVYDYDQMLKKLKNREGTATFFALLGGAAGAYNAAQAGTTTTYGRVGNTPFSATSYNSGLSNALAMQNANQTASNLNQIRRNASQAKSDLDQSLLRRQTMTPNSTFSGKLIIDNPWYGISDQWGGKLFITVPFGNEIHEFAFQVETSMDKRIGEFGRKQKTYSVSE